MATIVVGDAVSVEVAADGGPPVKVTVAVRTRGDPDTLAETVAVPTFVDDVSCAVYMPPPTACTGARDPAVVLMVTCPPELAGLPFESRSLTVTSDVDTPSAGIEVGTAVTVDRSSDARARTRSSTVTL